MYMYSNTEPRDARTAKTDDTIKTSQTDRLTWHNLAGRNAERHHKGEGASDVTLSYMTLLLLCGDMSLFKQLPRLLTKNISKMLQPD